MTEQEWLQATDLEPMLVVLRANCKNRFSDRKGRLLAVACCRRIWNLLTDERRFNACPCQPMQVVSVRVVETQGTREGIHRPARWGHGAALFQLHVPLDADTGRVRHLLAAQPGRAPATDARKAERLRAQSLASGAEEIA